MEVAMAIFNIHNAKTHFSKLLKRVQSGEEIIIARSGKPVARMIPYNPEETTPRIPGIDKGKVTIMPDFDDPLPEFD
jgi:prevent-host-death family protein